MRKPILPGMLVLALLSGCAGDPPVSPVDEISLATTLSVDAQAAMGGEASGPASILRTLVQQVREGDNARARALLARADELLRQAREQESRELAAEAHALVLQAVVLQFPNAATRIASVVQTGLDRTRAALGSRDAPRIRRVLDEIAGLLRQSAAAQSGGRPAIALDLALRASNMLSQLVDHVRGDAPTR